MTLPKRFKLSLLSPAKINLFFLVLGKRSDHFHEIASLYQAVNIFDTLSFEISNIDQFTCNDQNLTNSNNYVIKALDLFRNEFNIQTKLKIHLTKNIPIEAGLGGGSSNAATTLFACNMLFQKNYDLRKLFPLAEKIGADVPFFFSKGAAICTGKGEVFKNVDINPIDGWILKPKFGISTPKVYAAIDKIPLSKNYQNLLKQFNDNQFEFINDLQPFARKVEPRISIIEKKYPDATMTGSGSCFFTLKKPIKSNQIEKIMPFKRVFRNDFEWYSNNH